MPDQNTTLSLRFEPETFDILKTEASRRNRETGDYCMALIESALVASGAYAKNSAEPGRIAAREMLLNRVVEIAMQIEREDNQVREDITVEAVKRAEGESEWISAYARFVAPADPLAKGVPIKRRINPRFGSRVKSALGAETIKADGGRNAIAIATDSVIQSATKLRK